jgi:hypothetical protein
MKPWSRLEVLVRIAFGDVLVNLQRPGLGLLMCLTFIAMVTDVTPFTVTANTDVTPPTLVSLSVSPATVNAGETVTITAHLTDAESGIGPGENPAGVTGYYRLENGKSAPANPWFRWYSGTPQDAT